MKFSPLFLLFPFQSLMSFAGIRPIAGDTVRRADATPADIQYSVVIDKSDYELMLFENGEWIATYPVVFGNKDQGCLRHI